MLVVQFDTPGIAMDNENDFSNHICDDADLQIEEKLKSDVANIVEQRNFNHTLIKKATEKKDDIKLDLYKKVVTDYRNRLKHIEQEYQTLATKLIEALAVIAKCDTNIRNAFLENNDILDELRFRFEIGEFTEAELQASEADRRRIQQQLQQKIEIIDATYAECRNFLTKEDLDKAINPHSQIKKKQPAIVTPKDEYVAAVQQEIIRPPVTPNVTANVEFSGKVESIVATLQEDDATIGEAVQPGISLWDGEEERIFALTTEQFVIGRSPKCDICLPKQSISRKHAVITFESGNKYSLVDTSKTGILVNGTRQKIVELHDNDKIVIDHYVIIFHSK